MDIEQVKTALISLSKAIKNSGALDVGVSYLETNVPYSMYIIEPLKAICNASDEIRFTYMLKGLGKDPLDVERKMNELYNFVVDEERAFLVSDCFRKTLLSKTPIVCCVMGLILADIKSKTISMDQIDVIIMNAIVDFTDYDIRYFYDITNGQYTQESSGDKYIDTHRFPEGIRSAYSLTVDLCCQSRIFTKTAWVDDDGTATLDAIKYGEIAEKLRSYIERARRQLYYDQ